MVTKYYYSNACPEICRKGQRIAMRKNGTLTYLDTDHLGSTVLETNTSGNASADQKYFAYGNQRDSGPVVTDHKFTAPKEYLKLDGTGLMYYNSRYYDPVIGAFISPDTIVPDPSNLFDYNRYMMVRGNALRYSDPTGHLSQDEIAEFYGYEGEDIDAVRQSMISDGWAEDIVNWLSNPDTMFGDVFTYYNSAGDRVGEAMLSLFEAGSSWSGRQYRGGFYGLTGLDRGIEVNNPNINSLNDDTALATELEALYTGNYDSLPRRTGSDGHNYYDPAMYTYYRKRDIAGVGLTIIGGGATTITAAACASSPAGWIACMGGVAGLTGAGTTAGGVVLTAANPPSPPTYPTILTSRVTGNPPNLYSIWTPQGYYR